MRLQNTKPHFKNSSAPTKPSGNRRNSNGTKPLTPRCSKSGKNSPSRCRKPTNVACSRNQRRFRTRTVSLVISEKLLPLCDSERGLRDTHDQRAKSQTRCETAEDERAGAKEGSKCSNPQTTTGSRILRLPAPAIQSKPWARRLSR